MTKDDAVAAGSGFAAAFLHAIHNPFVEAGIKGLIGGILGYAGKLLLTWVIKQVKSIKTKDQKQNR